MHTLRELQALLGTANYVRAQAGPTYARISAPLKSSLKRRATFPPSDGQLAAIEAVKELFIKDHLLAIPDTMAALVVATAWLADEPPAGRPYEMGADTKRLRHRGCEVPLRQGKCEAPGAAVHASRLRTRVSKSCAACARRDCVEQLGGILAILQSGHLNITCVDASPLPRFAPKHFRWMRDLFQGGSRLLYRPCTGALHLGRYATSRHRGGRDHLIPAKASKCSKQRATTKGAQLEIEEGAFNDNEPER